MRYRREPSSEWGKVMICVLLLTGVERIRMTKFCSPKHDGIGRKWMSSTNIYAVTGGGGRWWNSSKWNVKKETSFIFLRASATTTERNSDWVFFPNSENVLALSFLFFPANWRTTPHISPMVCTRKNCCDKFVYCSIIKFYCKSILISKRFSSMVFYSFSHCCLLPVQEVFLLILC